MKIIQALRQIKDLKRKCDDLYKKVKENCADLDSNTPSYPDTRRQVTEWIQSYQDSVKEILRLKEAVHRTNLETKVTIELGGKFVEKSIVAWIERRRNLATMDELIYSALTDRTYKEEYTTKLSPGAPVTIVRRILYFDPVERDNKMELFRSEPSKINSTLEITNAITDLIE